MKKLPVIQLCILSILTLMLSSCEVVEVIFNTGVGIGIFISVCALILILIAIGVIRGKKR